MRVKRLNLKLNFIAEKLSKLRSFQRKFVLPFSIGLVAVLVPVIFFAIKNAKPALAWYNDNWHYRVKHTIHNAGSVDTNKKILVEIDTTALINVNKLQSDCGDSRFTDVNGLELKYFIDDQNGACNTNSTDYYVLIPQINHSTTVFYHYYGNELAHNGAQQTQLTEATFSPNNITDANEEASKGPTAHWKLDEMYDQKSDSKIEQQIEIMSNDQYFMTYGNWYDTQWAARKEIEITNTTSSQLTGIQIQVDVTYESEMQDDFEDLRFANSNGDVLNHYVESYVSSTSAVVWVKVDTISTGSDTSIWMYYGNSGASSVSNADNTFDFYDDFNGTEVDTSKWTIVDSTGISVSSGLLTATSTTGWLESLSSFNKSTYPIVETKTQHSAIPTNGFSQIGVWATTTNTFGGLIHPGSAMRLYYRDDGSHVLMYEGASVTTLLSRLVIRPTDLNDVIVINTSTNTTVSQTLNISNPVDNEKIRFIRRADGANTGQAMNASWDWIRVRKSAATHPTHTILAEETQSTVNTNADVFLPTNNSLGIIEFNPNNYNGNSVYLESEISYDGSNWQYIRSDLMNLPDIPRDYTVRIKPGNLSGDRPQIQLYNISDSNSAGIHTFGNTSNMSLYIRTARLIVKQSSPIGITDTESQIDIGSNEDVTSGTYSHLSNKKIYGYDADSFDPAPQTYFEANMQNTVESVGMEQHIELTNTSSYYTTSGSYNPSDNSLGLVEWDGSRYSNATVYYEAIISLDSGYNGDDVYSALYTEAGAAVSGSSVTHGYSHSVYARVRSGAITLTDGVKYTPRVRANGRGTAHIKSAQLVIIQSSEDIITETQNAVELGNFDAYSNDTYAVINNPKIYNYNASKYNPSPTARLQATVLAGKQPTIEQHINLLNQSYTAASASHVPTDNSLGLFRWDSSLYPNSTVYLEVIITHDSPYIRAAYAQLFTEGGSGVANSEVSINDNLGNYYVRLRSGAISLSNGTNYTVRIRGSVNVTLRAARLIVIQSDPTSLTATQAQVEIGTRQTAFTNTDYAEISNPKIYQYDQNKFTPTPESSGDIGFHATLKTDNASDTVYAELYNKTRQTSVAEVSRTGATTWGLATVSNVDGSANWNTSEDDEYIVRIKCVDGSGDSACSGNISNAKILISQTDATGITATQVLHNQIMQPFTDGDGTYSALRVETWYNPGIQITQRSFGGGNFNYYYEATLKTTAGTAYARLGSYTSSVVSTTNTQFERARSGDITSSLPTFPSTIFAPTLDAQIANSGSNTTTVASSWIIIDVTNLSTNGPAPVYIDLYNTTDSALVSGSEITSTSQGYTVVTSDGFSLTDGKDYVVRVRSGTSNQPVITLNTKLLLSQSSVTGIEDTQVIHTHLTRPATDTDSNYAAVGFYTEYNPENFKGANVDAYFEATLKTTAGTGYARLSSYTNTAVSTTSASYERKRSGNIYDTLPATATSLDTQIANSGANTTTASTSWLVFDLSNIGDPQSYVSMYVNGATCATPVTNASLSIRPSEGLKRVKSTGTINLTDNSEYTICAKTPAGTTLSVNSAKIRQQQSFPTGISKTEIIHSLTNSPLTDSDNEYTSQNKLIQFNPGSFTGELQLLADYTIKTSAGTGYARLYNSSESSVLDNSDVTSTSTSYERKRSNLLNVPGQEINIDVQLMNSATNTTTITNSWLVIKYENLLSGILHDSTSNSIHGALKGARWISREDCISSGCLLFDGVDDHIEVPDNSKLDFTQTSDFTVSLWFKRDVKNTDTATILAKYESTGSDGGYNIYTTSDGNVNFGIGYSNSGFPEDIVTTPTPIFDERWHHLSAVKEGNSNLYLYIDGSLVDQDSDVTISGNMTNNDPLFIGIDGDGVSNPWEGYLDDIKIYSYARSEQEIHMDALMTSSSKGTSASIGDINVLPRERELFGYWKLDENTTVDCIGGTSGYCDSSGNQRHLFPRGNTLSENGHFNNALTFDGTDDRALINFSWIDLDGAWQNRIKISFDNSSATTDLNNFPVLVKLDSSRIDYTKTQNSGQDIRFTDSDGQTQLSYEIETWDETGNSFVWVKVPNIPAGSSTDYIYMYYNNPSAEDAQNKTAVWDSNYLLVQHLHESSGSTTYDSTSNAYNGTKVSATDPLTTSDALIGNAQQFSSDYINTSLSLYLGDTNLQSTITLAAKGAGGDVLSTERTSTATGFATITINPDGSFSYGVANISYSPYWSGVSTTMTANMNEWNVFSLAINGSTDIYNFFLNGVKDGRSLAFGNGSVHTNIEIGRTRNYTWNTNYFNGYVDEVRISNTPRSDSWITAEHQTMKDLFNTYFTEEHVSAYTNLEYSNRMTLSMWINPTQLDSVRRTIATRGNNPDAVWYLQTSASTPGILEFSLDGGTNTGVSTTTLSTNNWYHVVLISDGRYSYLYINNQLESKIPYSGVNSTNGIISFGGDPIGGNGFIGQIDEIKIYNNSHTAEQISPLYNKQSSPLLHLPLNEGTGITAYDRSGNNYSGVWSGSGSYWTKGIFGSAGRFNGTDDILDTSFSLSGIKTISLYVKPTSGTLPIATLSDTAYVELVSGNINAEGLTNPLIYVNGYSSQNLETNVWQHVLITSETPITVDNFIIGKVGSEYYQGDIDDVKLYNYIRTSAQIIEDKNAGHPAPGSPIGSTSAWYKFDEGYETTLHDSSPNAYDGSISGAVWSNTGKFGKSLSFNGSNQYVSLPDNILDTHTEGTVCSWVYFNSPTDLGTNYVILGFGDTAGTTYKAVLEVADGSTDSAKLRGLIRVNGDSNQLTIETENNSIERSSWQHVCLTQDGVNPKIYVNGIDKTATVSAIGTAANGIWFSSIASQAENVDIGRVEDDVPSEYFLGSLDELKIYNFALTANQIKVEMNQGKTNNFGSVSTESDGTTPSNSASRKYCIPGDIATCNAPIAEWEFDENGGVYAEDTSGNSNRGTLQGNAKWERGRNGSALNFSDNSSYATLTSLLTGMNGKSGLTVSAWIKPDFSYNESTRPRKYVFSGGSYGPVVRFSDTSGRYHLGCLIWNTDGSSVAAYTYQNPTGDFTWEANTWHHLTCRYTGSVHEIYWDGNLIAYSSVTGNLHDASGAPAYIGANTNETYTGSIDNLRFYDYARTPAQINWEFKEGKPMAWWKFNECSGTTAYDSSENGLHGLINIGTTEPNSSAGSCGSGVSTESWNNGSEGKFNASLDFDGIDDYVTVDNADFINGAKQASFSFWVKPSTLADYDVMISKWSAAENGFTIRVGNTTPSGNIEMFVASNLTEGTINGKRTAFTSNLPLEVDKWTHVVAVYDGTQNTSANRIQFYINGNLVESSQVGTIPSSTLTTTSDLVIANYDGGNAHFPGQIDEVRIYNYALTATQIKSLFNGDFSVIFNQSN